MCQSAKRNYFWKELVKKLLLLATRKHTHTLQLARIFCPHACSFFKWHFLHDSLLDRIISYLLGPTASRLVMPRQISHETRQRQRRSWQEQLPNRQHHTTTRAVPRIRWGQMPEFLKKNRSNSDTTCHKSCSAQCIPSTGGQQPWRRALVVLCFSSWPWRRRLFENIE